MKIILFGSDGQVGRELKTTLLELGDVTSLVRSDVDFRDLQKLREVVRFRQPDLIVNAAAYTAVDQAESDPGTAKLVNADAVSVLAQEAKLLGAWLVHYSTDYVFNGQKAEPYLENDAPDPLSLYGKTKLQGEQAITSHHDKFLIFRTSWVYSLQGKNFALAILKAAFEKDKIEIVADQMGVPTSAVFLAEMTLKALHKAMEYKENASRYSGLYHLVPNGRTDRYAYARYLIEQVRTKTEGVIVAPENILAIDSHTYPSLAKRPQNSLLDTQKFESTFGICLPSWQYHVDCMIDDWARQKN